MAADDGGMFWVGQPLTTPQKKDCGLKMAADSGSVFLVQQPLTRREKRSRAQRDKEETAMMVLEMWCLILHETMFP